MPFHVASALLTGALASPAPFALQDLGDGGPNPGRVLWLRADQGVQKGISNLVSLWSDSGPASNLVVAGANPENWPEWEAAGVAGQPALRFDGNDWLYGYNMPTGSYTKVVVCRIDDTSFTNNVVSSVSHHALYFGGTKKARLFHSGDFTKSFREIETGKPVTLVGTFDANTLEGRLYQDGQMVGVGTAASANWDTSILLGSFAYGNFMKGAIAEVMVYDHVLSGPEWADLDAYLARRYRTAKTPEVEWQAAPRPAQLLQRDANGHATLDLRGQVTNPGFVDVTLSVFRDGVPWWSQTNLLHYGSNGKAVFGFAKALRDGLVDYDVSVFVGDGTKRQLVLDVPAVVVGDVWVINGQSNAQASDYHGEHLANQSQSHWLRSFGTASIYGGTELDLHWDLADGENYLAHASVGQWGIRLGETIVHKDQVPVAIINGAVGGTSITQHQRNDANPTDLTTIYGRLLYRMDEAGATSSCRGLVWYQGESDSSFPSGWYSGWLSMRADWQVDYPAFSNIYVFQIRNDCSGDAMAMKETQRALQDLFADTTLMSTTAAPGHDGCHYFYAGYRELGDRIARVLRRDFYGSTDTRGIDPPNPLKASWYSSAHRKVDVQFRDPNDTLVLEAGAEVYFETELGEKPVSADIAGDTIRFTFARKVLGTTLRYKDHAFDGPSLRNGRGVGALCFDGLTIQ